MTKRRIKKPSADAVERERALIPEGPCGERYCLCSGGTHAACKVASRRDQATREFLLSFSKK